MTSSKAAETNIEVLSGTIVDVKFRRREHYSEDENTIAFTKMLRNRRFIFFKNRYVSKHFTKNISGSIVGTGNGDVKVLRDMSQFAATNTITRTALGLLAHQTFSGIAGEEAPRPTR